MKTLKNLNTIAIALPLILLLIGFLEEGFFFLAAYSTAITGLIQIILGIIFLIKFKNNIHIKIYFSLVLFFFSLWYFNVTISYNDSLTWVLIFTPVVLCIYISILIYSKKSKL